MQNIKSTVQLLYRAFKTENGVHGMHTKSKNIVLLTFWQISARAATKTNIKYHRYNTTIHLDVPKSTMACSFNIRCKRDLQI